MEEELEEEELEEEEIDANYFTEESSKDSDFVNYFKIIQEKIYNMAELLKGHDPTIKIERIRQISGDITYSVDTLWDLLCIKNLNDALEPTNFGRYHLVHMSAPAAVKGSTKLELDFLIHNKSITDVPIQLRKIKICDCKASQKKIGNINLYTYCYDTCPHRKLFQIEPVSLISTPRKYEVLKFHIRYDLEGIHIMEYELSVSSKRKINLRLTLNVLPNDEKPIVLPLACKNHKNTSSDYIYQLHPVCISDAEPPIQFLWIYNSYNLPVEYCIECTDYWSAFNIKENWGMISPLSVHPVPILFKPYQCRIEEFLVILRTGDHHAVSVLIKADATLVNAPVTTSRRQLSRRQLRTVLLPTSIPVSLSDSRLNLISLCHGNQDTILHMENLSDMCVEYEWNSFASNGILALRVQPSKGIIAPFRTISLRVHMTSQGPPCIVEVPLVCRVTVRERPIIWENTGWFVITEEGYSELIPPTPESKIEHNIPLTISIRVVQCCASDRGLLLSDDLATLPVPPPHQIMTLASGSSLAEPMKSLSSSNHELKPEFKLYILCEFFDRILWDVIWCPTFKKNLSALAMESVPEYSQLKVKGNKTNFIKCPYLSLILQEVLYDSLHAAFELSSCPKKVIQSTRSEETCIASPDEISSSCESVKTEDFGEIVN